MKKDSLFELAEKKKLPLFQFIDAKTVRWIKINEPKFGNVRSLKLPKMEILKHYIPNNIWFLESKEINSIHGLRHILRVAINAYLIAIKLRHGGKISNLIIASVLHDIRRRNDKGDSEHGLRSAAWFKKNIGLIEKKYKIKLDKKDISEIYWSIIFHELPISDFEKNKNYSKFKGSVDIIRMADALDRFRLPKIKWWLNEEILGLTVSADLKKSAFDLVIKSEQNFLRSKDSRKSVLSVLQTNS